ncbi:hypothetical protein ABTF07_21130, partial [Acinetobacter baumannii]
ALPVIEAEGKSIRVVLGSLYGKTAPVRTAWDTVYADIVLDPGAKLPVDPEAEERAIYVVSGEIDVQGDIFGEGRMLV